MKSDNPTRPRLVVSSCLNFEACRYNGDVIAEPFLKTIEPHVEIQHVCPEVEIGLGTPREPVRLVRLRGADDLEMIQPATGLNVTDKMSGFSEKYLAGVRHPDGFVLKGGSPSCAVKDAKRYPSVERSAALGRGPGLFGEAVLRHFPLTIVEDEGRLKNRAIREHFLTRIFTSARFRELEKRPSARGLVQFQSDHKLLLLAYNQTKMREMGRLVANHEKRPIKELLPAYRELLSQALGRLPRHASNINVLMHAFGYVSDELSKSEKAFFLERLEQFRLRRIPLSTVSQVMLSWLIRFEENYLLKQFYFQPFPAELLHLKDSGRGRPIA